MFIVCLSSRAGKFERKAKSCLLFVYQAGLGRLKEGLKVVYCLFIQQGGKFKRKAKNVFIVCLSSMAGKIKRGQKLLTVIYLVGQFKRKAESCLWFVYQTGPES